MNYIDLYSSYPDHTIAAAWDSQVKEAVKTPWLAGTLTECGGELFARFAGCYAELRALPRSARRALQRRIARSSGLAAILPEYLQHGGRRLQHSMAWSLAGAALLLALGQGVATAAKITVTTNDRRVTPDSPCSLIEAIVNTNNDMATHTDCFLGSGAKAIVPPAKIDVTLGGMFNSTDLPLLSSRSKIEDNVAMIDGQGNAPGFGLKAVSNSGDLTLQSVTLSGGSSSRSDSLLNNGTLTIENSTISNNTAGIRGDGVYNDFGILTVANSTVSNNTANVGGANSLADGLTNSSISGNRANQGDAVTNAPFFYYYYFYGSPTRSATTIDFDGDGKSDIAVFRNGTWFLRLSNGLQTALSWGGAGNDILVAADYDGDHKTDLAVFQAGTWYIARSSDGGQTVMNWGGAGNDIPVPADYDGDGKTDIAVFQAGTWYIARSSDGGQTALNWGGSGSDIPVPADYDGDGKTDLAVFQNGIWYILRSSDGKQMAITWGFPEDIPVPADYDGDGKTDLAVYRAGLWIILRSSDGVQTAVAWGGAPEDIPLH